MTKGQRQVKEFMQFFGQETPDKPILLKEEVAKLRAKLILEEAFETITKGLGLKVILTDSWEDYSATVSVTESNLADLDFTFVKDKEVDLVELVDGLGDLAYVAEFGTAVAAGVDLEPIQDIIHRANMTKAWTQDQLEDAKRLYPTAKVEDYGGGLYRLVREDGKIIKSPRFIDPKEKIAAEIDRQKNAADLNKFDRDIYEHCICCPNCSAKAFDVETSTCNECGINTRG